MKTVLAGFTGDVHTEDGGHAMICEVNHPADPEFFVRIQSWSDVMNPDSHKLLKKFLGKNVLITIETIDD